MLHRLVCYVYSYAKSVCIEVLFINAKQNTIRIEKMDILKIGAKSFKRLYSVVICLSLSLSTSVRHVVGKNDVNW